MTAIIHQTIPPAEAVRATRCTLCGKRPGRPCTPKGDHLARWLAASSGGRITRDDLKAVIVRLTIVTKWTIVTEERAALAMSTPAAGWNCPTASTRGKTPTARCSRSLSSAPRRSYSARPRRPGRLPPGAWRSPMPSRRSPRPATWRHPSERVARALRLRDPRRRPRSTTGTMTPSPRSAGCART
jgi:hypothetical protein